MKKVLFVVALLLTLSVFCLNAQTVIDFTKPVAQGGVAVYTNPTIANAPMFEANGVRMMWAGDASNNGVSDAADRNAAWNNRNQQGYNIADFNLSGVCDASDRNTTWNNRNKQTHLPDNN
jgi:hypothetical protein